MAGAFEGSALYPVASSNLPQPLLPVCNKPMISYSISMLERAGISSMVVVSERFRDPTCSSARTVPEVWPSTSQQMFTPLFQKARRSIKLAANPAWDFVPSKATTLRWVSCPSDRKASGVDLLGTGGPWLRCITGNSRPLRRVPPKHCLRDMYSGSWVWFCSRPAQRSPKIEGTSHLCHDSAAAVVLPCRISTV